MVQPFQREAQPLSEEALGLYQILGTLLAHPGERLEISFLTLLGELRVKDPAYCENKVSEQLIKARDENKISLYEYEVLHALLIDSPKK